MVNERYAIAMSETLHYLKGINQNDLDIIPNKFIQFLNDNCSMDYECNFDYTKPLKKLDISNEARGLIAMICLNYWCTDEEQKEMFKKHLTENELKYQEELRKQYNSDDIFNNKPKYVKESIKKSNIQEGNMAMVECVELKWYQKVFNKILYIFRKNINGKSKLWK